MSAGLPANWNEGLEWFRTPYAYKHLSHTAVPAKSFEDAISQFGNSVATVTDSPLFDFFGVAVWEGWAP
jgi:hypothetical protein